MVAEGTVKVSLIFGLCLNLFRVLASTCGFHRSLWDQLRDGERKCPAHSSVWVTGWRAFPTEESWKCKSRGGRCSPDDCQLLDLGKGNTKGTPRTGHCRPGSQQSPLEPRPAATRSDSRVSYDLKLRDVKR